MTMNKHYVKGMSKVKENDFVSAIEFFSQAIEEDDKNAEFYAERAVCYIHTSQFDLSLFDMNRSVDLEPKNSYRYSCRAYLKGKMKDSQGAVDDYQRAVDLDPEDLIALNNLGIAQENLGYFKKAQENFKKSNAILGYDPENRTIEGDIAVDKKAIKENIPTEEDNPSKGKVVRDVFSKKSSFKEFVRFIGNGFKLKDNDKSRES